MMIGLRKAVGTFLVSAAVAAFIAALLLVLTSERRIAAEDVIQKKKEWRDIVRDLTLEVFRALHPFDAERVTRLRELRGRFALLINTHRDKDRQILELIEVEDAKRASEFIRRGKMHPSAGRLGNWVLRSAFFRKGFHALAWMLITIVVFVILPISALQIFTTGGPFLNSGLYQLTDTLVGWFGELETFYSALLLGFIAFGFSATPGPWYPLIEIFFGAYGGGVALEFLYRPDLLPSVFKLVTPLSANTLYSQYIALASAIYVMVRGLNNGRGWVKKLLERSAIRPKM